MMDLMGPSYSQQIRIVGFKRLNAIMNKPVVKNEINDAIS
jgi:hypothetical protein